MTRQGRRPSSANKKGATAMVTPLSIGYVSAGTYANFAPTIFAAAGLSKLPPVALPRAPMT